MSWWRGFYAVLDRDDETLAQTLVAGGARAVQLRMKSATPREILRVAAWLRPLTRAHGVAFVINDRIDLALAAEADAVHLGQDDMSLATARAIANNRLAIGISTHNTAQVREARAGGASYVGFGPIFTTTTKSNPDPVVGLDALGEAVALAGANSPADARAPAVPVIAIGGIALTSLCHVAATGAAGACVISAVNQAANVAEAARAVCDAFSRGKN